MSNEQWIPTAHLRWDVRKKKVARLNEVSGPYEYSENVKVLQQMMVNATTGEREWQDIPIA